MYMVRVTLENIKEHEKKQELKNLIVMVHRLSRLFDWCYAAARDDPNDVFYNTDPENSDAKLILSCVDFSMPEDVYVHREILEKRVEAMFESIAISMRGFKHKSLFGQITSSIKWTMYYKMKDHKKIWDHGSYLYAVLDKDALLRAFQLLQSNFVQKKMEKEKSLPQVEVAEVIMIPISQNDIIRADDLDNTDIPDMIDEDMDLDFVKAPDHYDPTTHYKIRINSVEDWGAIDWKKGKRWNTDLECAHFDCVIIYFHGGGFITGSSASYQGYTRQWSIETGFPVFSVEYRLAPEYVFPDGVTDCWQAYLWIVKYAEKYLKITFDKVILQGDSAGGNLILGVCNLAIMKKCRIPDGLNAIYPACDVSRITFSPSILLALDDVFLSASFLSICGEFYSKKEVTFTKPPMLLSPVVTPLHILKHYPPTRFVLSGQDPLRDGGYRLLLNIKKLGINIKGIEFKALTHGFLSHEKKPYPIPEAQKAVEKISTYLFELCEMKAVKTNFKLTTF